MLAAAWLMLSSLLYSLQLSSGSFPRPLTEEEERYYLDLASKGDLEARNILVERNLRLVAHIMKKYYAQTSDQEDLISIGTIGLIKGITTFDPSKGARLATYAARCVENAGVATARNKALAAVSGEYFMFVDSDDYLSADAVQLLYARLISDGSDMAVGKHTDVHEDGSTNGTFCEWMSDCVISGEESLRDVEEKRRFAGAPWGKLYKNTLFEGITYPMLSCGEDTWVLPLILQRCKRISVCSFLVYYYYQHEKSIMHVYNERAQRDDLEANLHVAQFLLQNGYHQGAHIWYAKCVNFAWRYKNRKDGIKLFRIYFSKAERRTLMKGQKGKIWIKWVALHIPFLYGVIHMVRNT